MPVATRDPLAVAHATRPAATGAVGQRTSVMFACHLLQEPRQEVTSPLMTGLLIPIRPTGLCTWTPTFAAKRWGGYILEAPICVLVVMRYNACSCQVHTPGHAQQVTEHDPPGQCNPACSCSASTIQSRVDALHAG